MACVRGCMCGDVNGMNLRCREIFLYREFRVVIMGLGTVKECAVKKWWWRIGGGGGVWRSV